MHIKFIPSHIFIDLNREEEYNHYIRFGTFYRVEGSSSSQPVMDRVRTMKIREGSMLFSNDIWFHKFAQVVEELVEDGDGALAVTAAQLRVAVIKKNPLFLDCPTTVFNHPTLPLRRQGLASCGYNGNDNHVLLIYRSTLPREVARARCRANNVMAVFSAQPALAM